MDESGDLSDDLDAFEDSAEEEKHKSPQNHTKYPNKPWDEGFEVSQDQSVAENFDPREKGGSRDRVLRNDKFDMAVDVSQSLDQEAMAAASRAMAKPTADDSKPVAKGMPTRGSEQTRSQVVPNKHHDEQMEFDNSDDSVDTIADKKKVASNREANENKQQPQSMGAGRPTAPIQQSQQQQQQQQQSAKPQGKINLAATAPQTKPAPTVIKSKENEESDEDADHEESYENLEGAYNPKDFLHLNITAEVKDLFQYIERYKPQEVELETTLKCFIPEYIPAIGEMDAFIKVPRPDCKEDDMGLKYLDEPVSTQSDPTVLELQLRAMSKKLQYGDVTVRSIENASKNPQAIEKWIQSIHELHRSKPPPQVHYRRNMPDMEKLMDVWPEEFENALETLQLPSPDLDLSLAEYAKVLCSVLDIPTYENPVESLHAMFTLFMDFRNNPHFQARLAEDKAASSPSGAGSNRMEFGGADVMEINSGYK